MDRVFNMGIGLVLVVSPYYAESIQAQLADLGLGELADWRNHPERLTIVRREAANDNSLRNNSSTSARWTFVHRSESRTLSS